MYDVCRTLTSIPNSSLKSFPPCQSLPQRSQRRYLKTLICRLNPHSRKPLLAILHLPPYTEQQFQEVSSKVLPKLKIAHMIGKAVWDQRGDVRDVISIGKLVQKNDGPQEVEQIISTMIKYDVLGVPLEVLQFYAGRLPADARQE